MQKRQAEYLQTMGVDLYVHRNSATAADGLDLASDSELVGSDILAQSLVSRQTPSHEPKVEVAVEAIQSQPEQDESDPNLVPPKMTNDEVVEVKRVKEAKVQDEVPKQQGLNSVPLHFLWQQQGRYLFLSAQERQPSRYESKLLDAIVRSISPSAYSESGEGKWPLTDSQPTTELETRDFLNSFVQGRSELCGTEVVLILFGEQSQKQFSEIEGSFEELLGKLVENEGKVCEFRIVPSLQTMLEEPQSKALTWQTISDLRASVTSA